MEVGSELELSIDRLAAGGEGVARATDGRVVFVPWTAPGDRVRVRIVECKRSFARATSVELLAPSPSRIEPSCEKFGSCGGCSWQHIAYDDQLQAKVAILRDALARVGHLAIPDSFQVHPSPAPYGYRSRARLVAEGGRVGYRRRRSRALCATTQCPVLLPALQQALAALASGADAPPHDGEWELFEGDDGCVRTVRLGTRQAGPAPSLRAEPGGKPLRVSVGVFAQANALLRGPLARAVLEASGSGARAVELFSGAGFLTLGLAQRYEKLVAVESHRPAVRDLRANLKSAGLSHVRVIAEPVERFLRSASPEPAPDLVVLDPPRVGLGRGCAERLARLGATRIVYLSCDPATLARDLSRLVRADYAFSSVAAFDLFPQTPHVEALAVLDRV